jgi:hypothetical protein
MKLFGLAVAALAMFQLYRQIEVLCRLAIRCLSELPPS